VFDSSIVFILQLLYFRFKYLFHHLVVFVADDPHFYQMFKMIFIFVVDSRSGLTTR